MGIKAISIGDCFYCLFARCSSLTTPPQLPATTLSSSCYNTMFAYCSSLTTAPELPATTLASSCYKAMFQNCRDLYVSETLDVGYDKVWTIPTTGTADGNYTMTDMFTNCLGTRTTDSPNFNGAQKTYYTQNAPV